MSLLSGPTLKELRGVCHKAERDPLWLSHYAGRPLSIRVTWVCVRLGLSSNHVTFISLVLAVAGSLALLIPSPRNYLIAAALILTFFLLDHVDGEVARYEKARNLPSSGPAGSYFDRLVHYYQGPSFYFCLAAGLAVADGNVLWLLPGVVAAVGSGGFPRFNAAYVLLPLTLQRQDEELRSAVASVSDFNRLYWKEGREAAQVRLLPRNVDECKVLLKQCFTFPGNLFVFAGVAVIDALASPTLSFPAIRAFLVLYSIVLFLNTIYATRAYLLLLSKLR